MLFEYDIVNKEAEHFAISPDGRILAIHSYDGVWLYDLESFKELDFFKNPEGDRFVAWSPDGTKLATGGAGAKIRIWDVSRGEVFIEFKLGSSYRVYWSPDGYKLAQPRVNETINILDAATGERLVILDGAGRIIYGVDWSTDGKYLAGAIQYFVVRIWDTSTGEVVANLGGDPDYTFYVDWSPNGKMLASGGNKFVRVWDTTNWEELVVLDEKSSCGSVILWSSDNK